MGGRLPAIAGFIAISLMTTPAPLRAVEINGAQLLAALKTGGYIIYLRHGISDTSKSDASPINPKDCSTQRPLSEEGRAQAVRIGVAMRASGVQLDHVFSSPYCRATETAALAFPKTDKKVVGALSYSLAMSKEDAGHAADEVKKMLAHQPRNGENTVLVGHTSNLKEAAGIWPKKEGSAVVFRPDGKGSFTLIGTIDPSDFEKVGS